MRFNSYYLGERRTELVWFLLIYSACEVRNEARMAVGQAAEWIIDYILLLYRKSVVKIKLNLLVLYQFI